MEWDTCSVDVASLLLWWQGSDYTGRNLWPLYREFFCTQYLGTERNDVVTGLYKKFPILSGIGLLKAFNNWQTLTLFFLNIFLSKINTWCHCTLRSQRFLSCPFCEYREIQQCPKLKMEFKFQREEKSIQIQWHFELKLLLFFQQDDTYHWHT